jgi:RND family efflux transporter MFP subunit
MKPIFPIGGVIVIAGLGVWLWLRPPPAFSTQPAPSATVSVVSATRQTVPRQVEGAGSIVAGAATRAVSLNAAAILTGYDVTPGTAVQAGQALATLAPAPMAVAALQKAESAVAAGQAARHHVATLLPAHLATAADLAAATQTLRDAQAALAALRATGAGQAETVRAPVAGLVSSLSAAPGGSLPAGTVLLKLAPASALRAQIGLTQSQAAYVNIGNTATLTLLNGGGTVAARVVSVAGALNPQTGLIDVMLQPLAPVTLGAPVAVDIHAGTLTGFPVPNSAVLSDDSGPYIYQLDQKNIAHRVDVKVLQQGDKTSVLAGKLNPAWTVAAQGTYQLTDGMRATLQGAGS